MQGNASARVFPDEASRMFMDDADENGSFAWSVV
jgi:hypothetical protein